MNPVFIILVILGALLLWLLLVSLYEPIGKLCCKLWGDAMDTMSDKYNKDNKKEESEEKKHE